MLGTIALYFNNSDDSDSEEATTSAQPYVRQNPQDHSCDYSKNDSRMQLKILRDCTNVFEIPDDIFIRTFRVNKEVFSMLLDEVTPKMSPTYRSTHVPAPIKLAKLLAFIGTGVATVDQGYASAMCKSQVSKSICELLDVFEEHLLRKWVIIDQNDTEEMLARKHFYNTSGFYGVVGCVDNMHVHIKSPEKTLKNTYNNKMGFTSLNVMLICDHNKIIKYVDASQPGGYHDDYVWDQSTAKNFFQTKHLNGKTDSWLIGDSAYNLLPYFMVPYEDPIEDHQKIFNEKLHQARNTIKRCIFILKNRFSCLIAPKGLYYSTEKAIKVINTCCILHNICTAYKSDWSPDEQILDTIESDDDDDNNIYRPEMPPEEYAAASTLRDEIAFKLSQPSLTNEIPEDTPEPCSQTKIIYDVRNGTNIFDFSDERFMKTFRVSKEIFSMLLEEIAPKLRPTFRSTHIPAVIKLGKFLVFLATGALLKAEQEYEPKLSKSTMSRAINEMLDVFEEHFYDKWIKLDYDQREEEIVKEQFYSTAGVPGVVGCIDNLHVQIKTPIKEFKDLYYNNNKGFYSINVLLICDHDMVIKFVDANQPGSYPDGYVWEQSMANNYFHNNYLNTPTNTWLIGDTSYILQPFMMVPYKNPNKDHEYIFNEKHSQIRTIIRKCIGILKNRFKCLVSPMGLQYTPDKATKIVITCCILHNICIHYKNYWTSYDINLENDDNGNGNGNDNDNDEDDAENMFLLPDIESANTIRDKIARNLY